jgi:2-polyprenyl-3-methyl-5-hydroxy-6-metoxy-1,4-benzoquinol methylase
VVVALKCPSCSSEKLRFIGPIPPSSLFAGRNLEKPLVGGGLHKCTTCSVLFRFPHHTLEELNTLYTSGITENWPTALDSRVDWQLVRNWIRRNKDVMRILDVGCYDGRLLESLGEGLLLLGVEIHPDAAARAKQRGIEIVSRDFTDLGGIGPIADVTIAVDVIEHSTDPAQFIAALASTVRPGGYVLISTGNSDALSWRLMGSRYWYCHIAEHVSFINPTWAKRIAPRVGLHLEQLCFFSHAGTSRTFRALVNEMAKNLLLRFAPRLFAFLRRRGFGGINVQGDAELELSPPVWMTARDHMFLIFRKVAS